MAQRSPPSRGRGSKHAAARRRQQDQGRPLRGGVDRNITEVGFDDATKVAPFAGAWIETITATTAAISAIRSPPSRGRGSKPGGGRGPHHIQRSPPSRGRGSKLSDRRAVRLPTESPPSRGRGSKPRDPGRFCGRHRRPLRGGVDRNSHWLQRSGRPRRRPLRGGVDRNDRGRRGVPALVVAPFAGAWIETPPDCRGSPSRRVAPFAGAWIETPGRAPCRSAWQVAPFAGAWIETMCAASRPWALPVAPFAGAWIETPIPSAPRSSPTGRPLRGGVDRNDDAEVLA